MRFTLKDVLNRFVLLFDFLNKKIVPPREYQSIYNYSLLGKYKELGIITQKQMQQYEKEPFGDKECKLCLYKTRCEKDK